MCVGVVVAVGYFQAESGFFRGYVRRHVFACFPVFVVPVAVSQIVGHVLKGVHPGDLMDVYRTVGVAGS